MPLLINATTNATTTKPLLINADKGNVIIYVDNCCNCQSKLKAIFGEDVIKLDVFHAVQRVTCVLLRKNPPSFATPCFHVKSDTAGWNM